MFFVLSSLFCSWKEFFARWTGSSLLDYFYGFVYARPSLMEFYSFISKSCVLLFFLKLICTRLSVAPWPVFGDDVNVLISFTIILMRIIVKQDR